MILELAGPRKFEATEAVIGGEKFLIVPADALKDLYRVAATEPETEAPRRSKPKAARKLKPVRRIKDKNGHRVRADAAPESRPDATTPERITAFLAKRPMTSGELLAAIGGAANTVYAALSYMRKAGTIETREDPADGERKNFLVNR